MKWNIKSRQSINAVDISENRSQDASRLQLKQGARVGLSAATWVTCPAAGRQRPEHAKMKLMLKALLQAKHESPYRLLTNESEQKLCTFNDQHYAKVNHTTKHITLAKQCTVPVFLVFPGTVCKMWSAAYSVEWEAHPSRTIDSWIRRSMDRQIRGSVDSWISWNSWKPENHSNQCQSP